MDDDKKLPQEYINTPFAYTKLSKNLSLLQQTMLMKVSEHMQFYIQKYFGSDLCKSRDIPRPLFSEAEKNNGMPDFSVTYAELGVSINNYSMANAAVKEVLALTIDAPGKDKDGNPAIVKYNIFTKANISSEESSGVNFSLNPDVVDYVFDMSQGYVRHPANIARIGTVERMPMMYYYLFKSSERWRKREVHLTVTEIKEYLGMRAKKIEHSDDEGQKKRAGRPAKEKVVNDIKEAYPKFSQFRKFVLDTSINDINRLKHEGLIDICVAYEPVYMGTRKVGNPAYIKFRIFDKIEDMQKATTVQQEPSIFAEKPGDKEWRALMADYKGSLLEYLKPMSVYSYDGKNLILKARKNEIDMFESHITPVERTAFLTSMRKVFGKQVNLSYYVPKE